MSISLELCLSVIAIFVSVYTYYAQNVKEEVFVYPFVKDTTFLVIIENVGNSTLRNYSINLKNIEHPHEASRAQLLKMDLLKKEAKFSLSPKKTHEIIIGSPTFPYGDNTRPILEIEVFNSKGKHKDTFTCDFNIYKNRISRIVSSDSFEKKVVSSLDKISKSIKDSEKKKE